MNVTRELLQKIHDQLSNRAAWTQKCSFRDKNGEFIDMCFALKSRREDVASSCIMGGFFLEISKEMDADSLDAFIMENSSGPMTAFARALGFEDEDPNEAIRKVFKLNDGEGYEAVMTLLKARIPMLR
jgi:hypothetical protein